MWIFEIIVGGLCHASVICEYPFECASQTYDDDISEFSCLGDSVCYNSSITYEGAGTLDCKGSRSCQHASRILTIASSQTHNMNGYLSLAWSDNMLILVHHLLTVMVLAFLSKITFNRFRIVISFSIAVNAFVIINPSLNCIPC